MFLGILDFRKSAISLSSSFSLQKKIAERWHLIVHIINHQDDAHFHRLWVTSVKYTPNGTLIIRMGKEI